jgi:hypothetical protein
VEVVPRLLVEAEEEVPRLLVEVAAYPHPEKLDIAQREY